MKRPLNAHSLCRVLMCALFPVVSFAQTHFANKGVINLRDYDFYGQGAIALKGEWEFYMTELIPPGTFDTLALPPEEYISFPSPWNDLNKALKPGHGYATYRVKVLVRAPRKLSLELPHTYSNYQLWINAVKVAANGTVGTSAKSSIPQWRPQTVAFEANQDTLEVVLHISNFHHAKGGIREDVYLGEPKELAFKKSVSTISTVAMAGFLFLIAILSILLFALSRQATSLLYLAGLCFTWSIRSFFSNRYVAYEFLPDFDWESGIKIEYITLYLMMIFAILFISSLFKQEVSVTFRNIFVLFNGLFVALTAFLSADFYTQFLPVYLSFAASLLAFIVYVLIRAVVQDREGVWLMVGCLFLGVAVFSYDIIAYQGFTTYRPLVLNAGYVVMFMLMALSLLYQQGYLKRAKKNANVLTFEELYGSADERQRRR